jgi:uncharacterized protein (TIGR00162 family)
MDKPYFHMVFHPKLENPVLVEGLPGFGNVGKIAARLLIEFTHAKVFAELYSPTFPDYVIVNKDGICRPPRYEFHTATMGNTDFVILTGDAQPSLEDLKAHYMLCDEILDFVEQHGARFLVTMGGMPTPKPAEEIYVASTSPKLAAETVEKGAILYGQGRIMGATGLLLGLAKNRGWKGICLLGATTGLKADRGAAYSVFKFLMKTLGTKTPSNHGREKEKG